MADVEYLTVPHLATKNLRRIFSKIAVNAETGCWEWTGALNTGGYGNTSVLNIRTPIHRILYAWLVEPIPKGLGRNIPQLDHAVCDNRRCVNPVHLKLVSARENGLRGGGNGAIYARRTHCPNGHLLPPLSTSYGETRRRCKLCGRDARQRELHRQAEQRHREKKKRQHLLGNYIHDSLATLAQPGKGSAKATS